MEIGSIRKIYCNTCKTTTNHELKALHKRVFVELDLPIDTTLSEPDEYEQWQYSLLICRGCETALLQEEYVSHTNDTEIEDVREISFHPEREKRTLPFKIFRQLNPKLARIYQEVITTFNHAAPTLCAVGLRALLEGICADKGVEGKTLYNKIDGLKAHLPANIVESLHRFRFIGNEAAHELQAPAESELRLAIEVMEDLLNFLYELDYKARNLFEGGVADPSTVHPSVQVIRRVIERQPPIPKGQKQLYQALYQAGNRGLEINALADAMGRTKSEVYGALGALGRRINNTPGVHGKPGVTYVFEIIHLETGDGWGWKIRPELRQALQMGGYEWAKGPAK